MKKLNIERLKDFERDPSNNFLTRSEMMEAIKELIAIRELKGDQVPVYQMYYDGFWRDVDKEHYEHFKEKGSDVRVLFTAPQKPVGLRQIGSIDHDGGEFAEYFVEFTDSAQVGQAVYVIDSAIEASGGIVKDGE